MTYRRLFWDAFLPPSATAKPRVPNRPSSTLILLACLCALCLASTVTVAQEVTGSIVGQVTDPQGAVLTGATVTATDIDRGTVHATQTNDQGMFTIPRLPIGNYKVSVSMPGFQKESSQVFALALNQNVKIDFQMKVGSPETTVEIRADTIHLDPENTQVGQIFNELAIEDLPNITHNYGTTALLASGTLSTNPGAFATGQNTFQVGRPYVNGQREQVNNYILDGMDNNQGDNNEAAYAPNPDAIQQFNLITQNPSAEFGNFLGGIVNVSIKSGTNQFHGEGFEYFRNYALNANNWFNNAHGDSANGDELNPRPKLRYNQFGATFGGPIIKEKLFFFIDYEGQLSSTPSTQTVGVLDAVERTGNLGELCAQAGGTFNASGQCSKVAGQLFAPSPGAIQASRAIIPFNNLTATGLKLSPAALALMNSPLYPLPNGGGNVLNYQQVVKNNFNQGDVKVDWRPNDKDMFFVRYSQQGVSNPTTATYVLNPGGITNFSYPLQNFVADWTRYFNSNLTTSNDLRFGFSYFPVDQNFTNPTGQNLPQAFGIPGSFSNFLPSLTGASGGAGLGNISGIGNNLGQQNQFHDTVIQFSDVFTKVWQRHEFHTGVQFNRYRDNFFFPGIEGLAGTIGFSGQYTSTLTGAGQQVGGSGLADLLLGLPSVVQLGAGSGNRYLNNSLIGAFFQDNWHIRNGLTLNLGLRWDLNSARTAQGGDAVNYALFGGQVETPSVNNNGLGAALYHTYNGIANFQPRIGLAWQPKFLPHTVIHAAFGISTFVESNGVENLLTANPPFEIAHSVTFSPSSNFPGSTLDQGFNGFPASGCMLAAALAQSPACFQGTTIHAFDPNLRPEIHNQWNLTVEHQFGSATTLRMGYVGSADQHLSNILDLEQSRLNANGTVTPSPFLNPTLIGFGGQDRLTVNNGIANYNALQTTLTRNFSRGLQAQVNYTWAKCLSDTPGFFGQFGDNVPTEALTVAGWAFPQNLYNQLADYGRCPQDVASLFNGYVVYQLPFGRQRAWANHLNSALDALVGGWTISTDFTFHSGFAQTIIGSDQSGTGSLTAFANCVPGASQEVPMHLTNVGGTPLLTFLNPAAVAPNVKGTFGNCGVGSFRGPGLKTMDLSLGKTIPITERQSVELRVDAVNFTNTPIFAFGNEFGGQHTQGSPVFGDIDASQGERQVQLGIKYRF